MIDFTKQEVLQEIKNRTQEIIFEDDIRQALIFIRNFKSLSSDEDVRKLKDRPEVFSEYSRILNSLSVVALSSLKEEEVVNIFEQGIKESLFNDDLNILEKTKLRALVFSDFGYRDVFKRKLREALYRNKETIGEKKISLETGDFSPTIANWLKKYSQTVGPKSASKVMMNQFLTADKDTLNLNDQEKKALRKVVSLFEYLKLSSKTPEGLEDPVLFNFEGSLKVLRQGYFEDVKIPSSVNIELGLEEGKSDNLEPENVPVVQSPNLESSPISAEEQEILNAYKGDPRQIKALTKETKKILASFGSDIPRMQAEFFLAVQKKNLIRTIALLRILAQKQELENFIAKDQKLNKFLTTIWQKQYGDDFVKEFGKKPDQLKFTKIFLRYVLEQRLGMSSNDAARIGLQIANIFVSSGKKSYNKMAYFDVKTKTFNWID